MANPRPKTSHLGRQNGYGRQKGTPNRLTADIKAMVLHALNDVGGREYLARQAVENPGPFLTLVGKVLPLTLAGDAERPIAIDFSWAPAQSQPVDTNAAPVIDAVKEQLHIAWDSENDDRIHSDSETER